LQKGGNMPVDTQCDVTDNFCKIMFEQKC